MFLFLAQTAQAQLWTGIGPASSAESNGIGGRVTSLSVNPADPDHWLLGSAGGGVWETKNAGRSWTPLTDSQPTLAIGSVTFAPGNPKIIYAGTGEANYVGHAQAGLGVLKSTDGGATWRMLGTSDFARTSIGRIRVDPKNPDVAVAVMSRATSGRASTPFLGVLQPSQFGVHRTTDGGQTWTRTLDGEDTSLEIDPSDFNNQYTGIGVPAGYGSYFNPAPSGLYRSSNAGQTWTLVPGPWSGTSVGRILIAQAPSDRNVLYVSIQAPDRRLFGLYRTNNAWASSPVWMRVSTTRDWSVGTRSYPDYCGPECTSANVLKVDAADPNILYAGGVSLWKCENCGSDPTWTHIGSNLYSGNRCLEWAGTRLIACTDGGVFSTASKGAPWRDDNGALSLVRFSGAAPHPSDPNHLLGGTFDNGLLRWTGTAWQSFATFQGEVAFSSSRPGTNLMASAASRIFRTTNGGQTFVAGDAGFDSSSYTGRILPVRKCPWNDDVFLSGTTRLQRNDNFFGAAATAWSAIGPTVDEITSIAFAESDRSCRTYAYGTATGRLFSTTNGGASWSDADPRRNIPARAILSIAFDPSNAKILYVALAGFNASTPVPGHLFKTKSALTSLPLWEDVSPGADLPHNVLAIHPSNPESIYAGTDAGVWYSGNGGRGWQLLGPSTGLPNSPVYDLKFSPASNRLVAFTFGRGAWALDPDGVPPLGRPPTLSSNSFHQAALAASFSERLGSGTSLSWTLVSGALPTGLVISPTGEITGKPSQPGTFTFRIQVRDPNGGMASQTYTLFVGGSAASAVWGGMGMPLMLNSDNRCPGNPECFFSGRVASLAVNPRDAQHWLVGFGNGGLWESRDAGLLWRPLADEVASLAIGALAFAPSNPNIIYAGTGEATGHGFTRSGDGILKSSDGGKTWTLLAASSFARAAVRSILVDPSNPNIVLATASPGGYGRDIQMHDKPPPFGVLRSTDGGVNWARTLSGYATALVAHSATFKDQYAALGDQRLDYPLGELPNGLYRSTDAGQTWNPVPGPWDTSRSGRRNPFGRIELAISPSNPNVLYAGLADPGQGAGLFGLYRTNNAWADSPTWIRVPDSTRWRDGYCGPDKCDYSHVLSVDPADPNNLFAGGGIEGTGIWRCANCGSAPSWSLVESGHSDYHAMAWAGNRLLVGNDGGVWSLDRLGAKLASHNANIPTAMFYSASLHPTNPDFILGGLRDFPVSVRSRGPTWTVFPSPGVHWGEAEVVLSSSRPETDWMIAGNWGDIYRTLDGGKTGHRAENGIDRMPSAFSAPVRKCPYNDNIFLTGTNLLWRTNNFFNSTSPTWAPNSPAGLPRSHGSPATILSIAYAPSDTTCNTYAFGTLGSSISITRDGGRSWTDLDPSKTIPARGINGLAFDPVNANILYVGVSGFNNGTPGMPGHVFKTSNALALSPAWTDMSPPQDQPFNVVAVDPENSRLVWAGSDQGLWRSNDAGATWIRQGANLGMPNAPVHDIQINPRTGRTVVFTYGRSAFALGPELISSSRSPANGATYIQGGLVPGSWAQVQGTNLAGVTRIWRDADFAAAAGALPTALSGVEVKVNGRAAAVYFVSPAQISFQVPDDITGTATVQVFRDGVCSNSITATAVARSPGIFPIAVNGKIYAAAVFLDGKITGDPAIHAVFRKARPGDILQLYVTGLAPSPAGVFVDFQPLSAVTVKVGDITVPADGAGLVAAGQFQVNFKIPDAYATLPPGDYPVSVQVGGVSSPLTINSNPSGPVVIPIQH
jgi:uncharacterized protein (TIGR03437 family)